jgi:predicted nucleotidyltransferase
MNDPEIETEKRLELAERKVCEFKDKTLGMVLTGSVAYSPNYKVNKESDVDLVLVVDNIKEFTPFVIEDKLEAKALENRVFEGYCLNKNEEGIPLSLHIINKDAFDIISKAFVEDIRVYRQSSKQGNYDLLGFEGNRYEYEIKNVPLDDLDGFRTIVPVSFISDDRYYLGIHRDKLLSNSLVLFEESNYISGRIDKLWRVMAENLKSEAMRLYGDLNLEKMNILNTLAKKDKMTPEAINLIKEKTAFYLHRIK